jgi:hypothetical protein
VLCCDIEGRDHPPATLERAACQPLLNAALEGAAVNKPLLFLFLRELISYYTPDLGVSRGALSSGVLLFNQIAASVELKTRNLIA